MAKKRTTQDITKEQLQEFYWNRKLSMAQIGTQLGISPATVCYLLKDFYICKRNRSEAQILAIKEGHTVKTASGKNNPNYKGGSISQSGYIHKLLPNHPRANIAGYVCEHILIWEQANGRPLPDGWCIHHLNGIRKDNRPENLFALPRRSHHGYLVSQAERKRIRALESELKAIKAQGVFNG